MQTKNLKKASFSGFVWMFGERICAQLVTFIVSLVLARLLVPEDYGAVAIALIFINLANVFVSNGLNAALIQKKNTDDLDYSTSLISTMTLAIVFYLIIFFIAPIIADIYKNEILGQIIRILGLRIPIGAINSIQKAYVTHNLRFKLFFVATSIGTIISAIVGIAMALLNFGVWAIVGQNLTNSIIDTIVLLIALKWYPKLKFSYTRFKEMFSFSWKVFISSFFNQIYLEIRSFVIGKKYSSEDLAYYNRGKQFPQLFFVNIASSISSVMFPVMSKQIDNKSEVKKSLSITIRVLCFILFPIMFGLAITANPIIDFLLTSKWLPCVPYLQAYSISYAILPIQTMMEQMYKAVGKSGILVKLFIVEKTIGIIVIILTMQISVKAIAIGMVIMSFFETIYHVIPAKKEIDYSIVDLINDIKESLFFSLLMVFCIFLISLIKLPSIFSLIIQIIVGILIYFLCAYIFKSKTFKYILELINEKLNLKLISWIINKI